MANVFDDGVVAGGVTGNYISKTNLTSYGVSISSIGDAQLALLIADVEEAIERHTGDQFYLTEADTKYFDGTGRPDLFFMPVTSLRLRAIDSIDFWNMVTSASTLSLVATTDYRLDDSNELVRRTDGGVWTKGRMNIRVIGDWGWSSCPDPIRWCAALMIASRIDLDFKGLHVDSSLRWPHLAITRHVSAKRIAPITGYPSIDQILWNYRRITAILAIP